LAGVSTPFSIGRDLEKGKSRQKLMIRVIKRGLILVILGIIYNNGLQLRPISDIRFPSVLGKIGVGYMFANIIYLYAGEKAQMIWFWSLLIGYWLLLRFTSAPGYLPGDLTIPGNFMSYFDRTVLPGKLSKGIHDTVGLLNIITAVSTALSGILAGNLLKKSSVKPQNKAAWMGLSGVILLLLSFIWNLDFPINKNLWSSSFVLLTSGMSLILLAGFYYFIDVLGYRKWTFFFRVIGLNSILIYLSGRFINWQYTTNAVFKWLGQWVGEPFNVVVLALCTIAVEWLFLYFMYRKKVFLRV
jgi:predicted acyltransferase